MLTALWYFDVISPFAYLQWQQLRRRQALEALPVQLQPRPILFAGLLKHHGQRGPAEIPSKRRYTYRHVVWLAQQQGTPLRFPAAHPFNPLPLLRMVIAAGNTLSAVDQVFDYVWRNGHLPSDTHAIEHLAHALGLKDWVQAVAQPAVKQQLIDNTQAAQDLGVFGVPTLVVDDELFWGQDSTAFFFDYVAQRGTNGGLFASAEMSRVSALPAEVQRKL